MKIKNTTIKKEYGDFQTPLELSQLMVNIINEKNIRPNVIIEPTCGLGNVLLTAFNLFLPYKAIGIEINNTYCESLKEQVKGNNNFLILNNDIFASFGTLKQEVNNEDIYL